MTNAIAFLNLLHDILRDLRHNLTPVDWVSVKEVHALIDQHAHIANWLYNWPVSGPSGSTSASSRSASSVAPIGISAHRVVPSIDDGNRIAELRSQGQNRLPRTPIAPCGPPSATPFPGHRPQFPAPCGPPLATPFPGHPQFPAPCGPSPATPMPGHRPQVPSPSAPKADSTPPTVPRNPNPYNIDWDEISDDDDDAMTMAMPIAIAMAMAISMTI